MNCKPGLIKCFIRVAVVMVILTKTLAEVGQPGKEQREET